MRYDGLKQLINNSNSSREYFLSLPVKMQIELHMSNDFIHSAADLHKFAENSERYHHSTEISEMLFNHDTDRYYK